MARLRKVGVVNRQKAMTSANRVARFRWFCISNERATLHSIFHTSSIGPVQARYWQLMYRKKGIILEINVATLHINLYTLIMNVYYILLFTIFTNVTLLTPYIPILRLQSTIIFQQRRIRGYWMTLKHPLTILILRGPGPIPSVI